MRAEFLQLRETDFVAAAKALGASPRRIMIRHMLPGAMAPLVVALSLGVADAIIGESALSFLGFGIAPPEITIQHMFWGVVPFITIQLLCLLIVATFPQLVLWLPSVMLGFR